MLLHLLSPVVRQLLGLIVCQERALDTFRSACISREIEHIAVSQQVLGSAPLVDIA